MSPDPIAVCKSLSKTYLTPTGGIEALHAVDASFAAGEVTALVGASGSGKSTLLRALAGLDRVSEGSLSVEGRELGGASPAELRRHRRDHVTYVSQKAADNLIPHLAVSEQPGGASADASTLLESFGLDHRLRAKPIELSGGEQARAAFALALARHTPLVLADEPTAELDRSSAGQLLEAIRRQAGAGTAFVIATHDPDVIAIADHVVRLDRGRIVAQGTEPSSSAGAVRSQVAAEGAVVVRIENVSKAFRRGPDTIQAIRDATLELRRGSVGVLLGRSGSGKSTLLMLLAGWQAPDRGSIDYLGGSTRPEALPWAELSLLPQRFGLLPELTVRENIELPLRLSTGLGERSPAVEELLEQLGLDELAARQPHETSIGQQQRTALARALVLAPRVLLADEPTSHQDAGWRDAVWRLLLQAAAAGTTCLVATHEDDVARYATHLWRFDEGALVSGSVGATAPGPGEDVDAD